MPNAWILVEPQLAAISDRPAKQQQFYQKRLEATERSIDVKSGGGMTTQPLGKGPSPIGLAARVLLVVVEAGP